MWSPTSASSFSAVDDEEASGSSAPSRSQPSSLFHQSLSQNRRNQNQNQNPHPQDNQTLEDAFARLSLSPFSFELDRDGINGATKTVPFDRREFRRHHTINNVSNAAAGTSSASQNSRDSGNSSNSFWSAPFDGYTSSNWGEFLDPEPLLTQNGHGRGLSSVPLPNGGDELQRNPSAVVFYGSIFPGLNGDGRSPVWLSDLRGRIVLLAKDQHGSLILKEKMESLTPQEVSFFLLDMINDVADLMVDPFGTHVVQKILEICNEQQRTLIILMMTRNNLQFVKICLNHNGIRAVEKLLERVTTQEQRTFILSGLMPGAVALAKDVNGHRVILHCLKYFSLDDTKNLLNTVANNCFGIATDKTGCCMLQECVKYAQGATKWKLIAEIIVNASFLAEDCYGNYVVQHLLSLKIPVVTESLLGELQGTFFQLASNKYGSNVVEKFFQYSGELNSARIILELLHHPKVATLLVNPYGNYVVQTALVVSKGVIRDALVQLIQINSSTMRSNLYGKKVLERFDRVKLRATHNRLLL